MSIVMVLLVSAIAATGYYLGGELPLSGTWTYFEALRTTSAIVFGVMSALLAIVYPEVVKQGFRPKEQGPAGDLTNIGYITNPLAQSAVLLIVLVILGPVFVWAETHIGGNISVRGAAFALLTVLTFWQVAILVMLLRPLDLMHTHTTITQAKAERRRRIHSSIKGSE